MAAAELKVYTPRKTPRLSYVLNWILKEQLGISWTWAENGEDADLVYGHAEKGKLSIPEAGLMLASGLSAPEIHWGHWKSLPVPFATPGSDYSLPFDLFSAVFYCLSRYEEYSPSAKADEHGRFDHRASLFYSRGLLTRPLVDEWIRQWGEELKNKGYPLQPSRFQFLPSFDIDQAFAFLHQPPLHSLVRSLNWLRRKPEGGRSLIRAWRGISPDPYDRFEWMDQLQEETGTRGLYFFLLAPRLSEYDRNLSPFQPSMQSLVKRQAKKNEWGMHPSYYSLDQPDRLREEKQILEEMLQKPVLRSRQHYIRWTRPGAFRHLLDLGIREDYSMGYAQHTGFRAGTSRDFLWYDLEQERPTSLRLFPFCFMDTTARFYHGWEARQAFEELNKMAEQLKGLGGQLMTIFHNSSLGSDPEWKDWGRAYGEFHRRWALLSNVNTSADPHE